MYKVKRRSQLDEQKSVDFNLLLSFLSIACKRYNLYVYWMYLPISACPCVRMFQNIVMFRVNSGNNLKLHHRKIMIIGSGFHMAWMCIEMVCEDDTHKHDYMVVATTR